MITFQLDQCLDSKRFSRDCAAEGLCHTVRLPADLRGAQDPVLLHALMGAANALITFDRALPRDHVSEIPEHHPGVIVVSNYPALQTMTIRIAQQVLHRFKTAWPNWHQCSVRNSVIEITRDGVELWHVEKAQLTRDAYLEFKADNWQAILGEALSRNATRG